MVLVADSDAEYCELFKAIASNEFLVRVATSPAQIERVLEESEVDAILAAPSLVGGATLALLEKVRQRRPAVRRFINGTLGQRELDVHFDSGLIEERFTKLAPIGTTVGILLNELTRRS